MESGRQFIVLEKEVQNATNKPVEQYRTVSIRVQKEGSVSIPYHGVIGRDDFNAGLQSILKVMRQGERWRVADNEKVNYVVEIVEVGELADIRSHLQKAEALKQEANVQIKAKQNAKAITKYQDAYNFVINDPSAAAQELKLSLISNLALASLNLADFQTTIRWCSEHLEETLEPNIKIVYRRASAYKGLRNWTLARKDIELGLSCSADDAETTGNFKKLQTQLQKQFKEQKQREKAVYGKMFG